MLLLALSTAQKIGLGLAVLGFAGFSLIVSMLVPRWYPQFPGRGLRVFLVTCLLLFVGMMSAVIFVARESSAEAKGPETTTQATSTQATTSTSATTTASAATSVPVSETEFKIALPKTTVPAGSYAFEVKNDGHIPHDFVVQGNGVDERTPTDSAGQLCDREGRPEARHLRHLLLHPWPQAGRDGRQADRLLSRG